MIPVSSAPRHPTGSDPTRKRQRLDALLLERGLFETRARAQAAILAGRVYVNGQRADKAGAPVPIDCKIEVLPPKSRFVSRAGLKLEAALDHFGWDVRSQVILDIGSSTGGFVDCLLQRGAAHVFAVDVGTAQLDWRLRHDPRVSVLERTNARRLRWEQIGQHVDGITMDVSFISATLILPALVLFARPGTWLLVLVKPQFEVSKGLVGKGGIVKDPELQQQAVARVRRCAESLSFRHLDVFPSPVLGADGNQEFFLAGRFSTPPDHSANHREC